MAYSKSERYTLPLSQNNIRLPAVVLESHDVGYNDELKVQLYPENENVNRVEFTGFINSGNRLTIPATVRNNFADDEVTVSFEATGRRWSPEMEATARKAVYESAHPEQTSLKSVTDIVSADD
jgi:hypothetical protein